MQPGMDIIWPCLNWDVNANTVCGETGLFRVGFGQRIGSRFIVEKSGIMQMIAVAFRERINDRPVALQMIKNAKKLTATLKNKCCIQSDAGQWKHEYAGRILRQ